MKKRLIALPLALTMVGALLAGCGGKDNTPGDTQQPAGDQQTNEPAGDTQQPADPAPADPAPADIDYKTFTIDPAQIPQEKLDTTLYLAVSIRGLENPYIATIKRLAVNEKLDLDTAKVLIAEYKRTCGKKEGL